MANDMKNINELNDDELETVSGGVGRPESNLIERNCPKCGCIKDFRLASGGRAYCMTCGEQIVI